MGLGCLRVYGASKLQYSGLSASTKSVAPLAPNLVHYSLKGNFEEVRAPESTNLMLSTSILNSARVSSDKNTEGV